jgi:Domain of unknown function (DUF1963)
MWGDVGKLYFTVRPEDLAARDFSRAWMVPGHRGAVLVHPAVRRAADRVRPHRRASADSQASTLPVTWADTYFEIARRHDEFGYLTRSEIAIQVDSKENFEANYSGNWYHYFK